MIEPLVDPRVLKSVLASQNIQAAKSLGQNFLVCAEVIDAVLMGLDGGPKNVTELGPGLGTLTQGLIAHRYHVRGIEKDDEFVKILPTMLPPKLRANLNVIHGDLTEVPWEWDDEWALVGNIPYNLSGLIIRLLTKMRSAPSSAIFLMQKEVVDRILMRDNNMSLLSLAIGLWGSAELLLRVPPSCFIPQPKVYSSVIQLRASKDALPVEKREEIIAKAKSFFQAKRKQLAWTLKRTYALTDEKLSTLPVSSQLRPENLSVKDWIQLCDIL
jgi:16S rRNA (adenine1518-N6/adenine1519-N6)-dimethyltransferase